MDRVVVVKSHNFERSQKTQTVGDENERTNLRAIGSYTRGESANALRKQQLNEQGVKHNHQIAPFSLLDSPPLSPSCAPFRLTDEG